MERPIQALLLFLALLSFCSCEHKSSYPQPLLAADSLTYVYPDSAIALLESLESDIQIEPENIQMYYRLLCIKANDKAYIQHSSDSLILSVLSYYIKKNDHRHLPEAYYYAGRVYRSLGDAPQALGYFEKAIAAFPKNEGHRLKSKIYSQMGTLFDYQGMWHAALEMYQKGKEYDDFLKDSIGLIFKLRNIGVVYRQLENTDSVLSYFRRASQLSQQLQQTDMFNMMQSQLAAVYIDLQEYDSARMALQNALKDIKPHSRSAIYSIAARFLDTTGQRDSAIWYYNQLLDIGTVHAKRAAYRRLLQFAIAKNDALQASGYLQGYLVHNDSIQKLTQTEAIQRMHSLYNYRLREQENTRLQEQNEKQAHLIWIIAGGFAVVLSTLVAYWQYSRRRNMELHLQLERLQTIEKENREKEESLKRYKSQKEELESNLANTNIQENNIQQKQLRQKIALLNHIMQQQAIENEQEKEAQEQLYASDLYQQLQKRASSARGEASVTDREWDMLESLITPAYPTFLKRLHSLHTPSKNELHVCLLIKLQFRQADIARLLQLKPESVSSIRRRLYQKTTGNKGTPDMWDKIIHQL